MVRKGELESNRAIKLRLFPTEKQEVMILHNVQISKFAYVWARKQHVMEYAEWSRVRDEYRKSLPEDWSKEQVAKALKQFQDENMKKYISSPRTLNTKFTKELKEHPEQYAWFGKYDSNARHATICVNYDRAFSCFIKGLKSGEATKLVNKRRRKLKKKHSNKILKFPQDYGFPQYKKNTDATSYPTIIPRAKLNTKTNKVYLPMVGWVRFSSNQTIPDFIYPSVNLGNPTVSTDGHDFYLSFGYYEEFESMPLNEDLIIGVDLGVKNIAILSDGDMVPNIANDPKVVKLNNKIKKLQRKLCWLREHSEPIWKSQQEKKDDKKKWAIETRQTRRLNERINKAYIALDNYKRNWLDNWCLQIVNKRPKSIVFENLNVKGMQQNKKLSSKLQQTGMSKFKTKLIWHAKKRGIEVREVDRFYPSSQICSQCGYQYIDMKDLSKRKFDCPNCGSVLDRDVNAALNLKAQWDKAKII